MLPTTLLLPPAASRPEGAAPARRPGRRPAWDGNHQPVAGAGARPARDRFVDVVRAFAIILVVLQHWLMPVLSLEGGQLRTANAFAAPGAWPGTWVGQVMPLIFFAGGASAAMSLRRVGRTGRSAWAARRLHRLAAPVLALIVVWLPLPYVLIDAGVPPQPVAVGSRLVGGLLWFLALYSVITVLAPVLVRLAARARGLDVVGPAVGAVVVDVLRFGAGLPTELAYVNVLLVWGAVHQVGVHYAAGRLWWVRGSWALALGMGGFTVVALTVGLGPYPLSMIGMPGDAISNMGPPSAVLLALAVGQLALALAARPAVLRWAARPDVSRRLDRFSGVAMTVYLWHTPALVLVAGVAVIGLGHATPAPFTPAWWAAAVPWVGALAAVLTVLVRLAGPVERRLAPRTAGPLRLAVATVLVAGGLLGLTLGGFTPTAPLALGSPLMSSSAIWGGLVLLTSRPTIDRSVRSSAPERG